MDLEILEAGIPLKKEWVDLADKITCARPKANRDHDQIYMMSGAMIFQTLLMHDYIEGRDIVFVGDGDSMSLMFGLFSLHEIIPKPRFMYVLDMDKRTLRNIKDFANAEGFGHIIDTQAYNVFDPIPAELAEQADFFYTNPPYGSKNDGRSSIVFLARCMELTKRLKSSGVVILPYSADQPWSISVMNKTQQFLIESGYTMREMICNLHHYHLPDNPILASGYIVVDRTTYKEPKWKDVTIPKDFLKNFYGETIKQLPHYIEEDDKIVYWE